MTSLAPRLAYADVVATLALVVAVGGASAFAATTLPEHSVGAPQLKNGAVITAKIRAGAVTGAKLDLSTIGKVPAAGHADDSSLVGGLDPASLQPRAQFATVAATGLVLAESGGITVEHAGTGTYLVALPASAAARAVVGVAFYAGADEVSRGVVVVGRCGSGADAITCGSPYDDNRHVLVTTTDQSNLAADLAFEVVVL